MNINIDKNGRLEIWLTGSDVRRLERGGEISANDITIYMDFFAGETNRANQPSLKSIIEDKYGEN